MAMFKDPIAPKSGMNAPKGKSGIKQPAFASTRNGGDFACGTNYGVGYKNPVGKDRASSFGESNVIPKKSKSARPEQVV